MHDGKDKINDLSQETQNKKRNNTPLFVKAVAVVCIVLVLCITAAIIFSTVINSGEIAPRADERTVDEPVVINSAAEVSAYGYVSEVDAIPDRLPENPDCHQVVLAKCEGSFVELDLYESVDGQWVHRLSTSGRCGKNGISAVKTDGDGCTPSGEFPLSFCCGISKPDTKLDFQWIDADTVWVNDSDSVYYNTLQSSSVKGEWQSAEAMYSDYFSDGSHTYCVNIASNGDGLTRGEAVSGRGALITLCGRTTALKETEGCIDIPAAQMSSLLGYLDSSKNPEIIIY